VLAWTIEGAQADVGAGEALLIPRGAVHQFDTIHDVDVNALAIVTPRDPRRRSVSTSGRSGAPVTCTGFVCSLSGHRCGLRTAFLFLVTCVEFVELGDLLDARVVSRMHTPERRERLPAPPPNIRLA